MVARAPSQPRSSPPNVSRQPLSQPVPAAGECGHRSSICSGSMSDPYAPYTPTSGERTDVEAARDNGSVPRIVIIGGGPAGYESALDAPQLGVRAGAADVYADAPAVNQRIKDLARQQSDDITARLVREGVTVVPGAGRLAATSARTHAVEVLDELGVVADSVEADVVLLATGGTPRVLADAEPDGERILSWRDVYDLKELPGHLVVVGSGVTGAEFASGYSELGVPVTLVSSRDRVLPGEDPDAAEVIEQVFTTRGGTP